MTQPRSVTRRPWPVSAVFACAPLLALTAFLTVAPAATAQPKTCSYKPAACQLEAQRAARRADAAPATSSAQAQAPGRAKLPCASKTAACDLQQKARAKQAQLTAAAPARAGVRPPACNLKSAACGLEEQRSAR